MLQLEQTSPYEYEEYLAGNIVAKESTGSFNQVSTDQAAEHINKQQCNVAGGLVGITSMTAMYLMDDHLQ